MVPRPLGPGLTVPSAHLPDPPSPGSPSETFAAPPEVRHFTDGTFPPGFVLQLFSHTQSRTTGGKDARREGTAAEGGLPEPESPSPGEPPRGDDLGDRQAASLGWGLPEVVGAWTPRDGAWGQPI